MMRMRSRGVIFGFSKDNPVPERLLFKVELIINSMYIRMLPNFTIKVFVVASALQDWTPEAQQLNN